MADYVECKHGIPLVFCGECYIPRLPAVCLSPVTRGSYESPDFVAESPGVSTGLSLLRWRPRGNEDPQAQDWAERLERCIARLAGG